MFEDVAAEDWYVGADPRQRTEEEGGNRPETKPSSTSVEIRDPRFARSSATPSTFEKIATGFLFTEGRCGMRRTSICCSATCRATTCANGRAQDGVTTFRKPCAQSNGLAWDRQGRLLVCEHATSRVTRTETDGRITVIASHHDGKELNSPNDIVVKSDGGIYFTDPTYGRNEYYGNPRPLQLDFRGVYRVEPDGEALTLLADDFGQPNGLCFSLDEKQLFVNDTDASTSASSTCTRRHAGERPRVGGDDGRRSRARRTA